MLFAAILWLLYLAIEPYIRRHLPNTLVTWARVLSGKFRDPLVASDLLLGTVFGIASANLYATRLIALAQLPSGSRHHRHHSGWMLASFTTLPHLADSVDQKRPKSSGVLAKIGRAHV